jgi:hypothetical protein
MYSRVGRGWERCPRDEIQHPAGADGRSDLIASVTYLSGRAKSGHGPAGRARLSHATTQRAGRSVECNRLARLRRFQWATARMATQHSALIEKHTASAQSERLTSA